MNKASIRKPALAELIAKDITLLPKGYQAIAISVAHEATKKWILATFKRNELKDMIGEEDV